MKTRFSTEPWSVLRVSKYNEENKPQNVSFISFSYSPGDFRIIHFSTTQSTVIINKEKFEVPLSRDVICEIQYMDGFLYLSNKELEIETVGTSFLEVEKDFIDEFNYLFKRLNSLSDDLLSSPLQKIKNLVIRFL